MSHVAGIPLHARWIATLLYLDGQTFTQIGLQFGVRPVQARDAVRWQAYQFGLIYRDPWNRKKNGALGAYLMPTLERKMAAVGLLPEGFR